MSAPQQVHGAAYACNVTEYTELGPPASLYLCWGGRTHALPSGSLTGVQMISPSRRRHPFFPTPRIHARTPLGPSP